MIFEIGSMASSVEEIAECITPKYFNEYNKANKLPIVVAMALLIKADNDKFAIEEAVQNIPAPHPRMMFSTKCDDKGKLRELYFELYNISSVHKSKNLALWKTSAQMELCFETMKEAGWMTKVIDEYKKENNISDDYE